MKHSFSAYSFALLLISGLALSSGASAEPIYEHTDEAGVASFSDQPVGPDDTKVEVNPNVVEVAPVVMPEPLPEREDKNYSTSERQPELPEVEEGGDNYYYEDGIYKRRRLIEERHEHRDPENRPVRPVQPIAPGTPVNRPAHPAARPAVR